MLTFATETKNLSFIVKHHILKQKAKEHKEVFECF